MIGGKVYPIRTDFRTGVRYEMAAMDGSLTAEGFYDLWFPAERPEQLEEALQAVGLFYNLGRTGDGTAGPIPYGFRQDAGAVFAAFRRHYGMDLGTAELHWWHFRSLLEGLVTHSFRQRVGYRTADLRGLTAGERAEILKYRGLYAIQGQEEDLESHLRTLDEIIQKKGEKRNGR